MEILFVATELSPMAKVGGLADVVFALSKSLKNLGHRVTLALPRYPAFDQAGVLLARRLTPLSLPGVDSPDLPEDLAFLRRPLDVVLYDARLGTGVDVVFFDVMVPESKLGPAGSLFGEVSAGNVHKVYEHPDAAVRFALFNRAVVELLRGRAAEGGLRAGESAFDVVHLHDWPTAMVSFLIRENAELRGLRTVLTLHDASMQGLVPSTAISSTLAVLGLSRRHFTMEGVEFYGTVSLLKGGVVTADAVTTVSPTYASEISTDGKGFRMEGLLRAKRPPLVGILNGVDYSVWNPATDPNLVARYDADDWTQRGRQKTTLLAELGLPLDPEIPLFVSLGRLTHAKGSDVLASALPRLAKQDLSLVVAGRGDAGVEAALTKHAAALADRVRFLGFVEERRAHQLLAAADFVLMPSRSEPCGLVQMFAQRYGAIPIVTRTGGLVDTVVDVDADLETGTGIVLPECTVDDVAGAVGRAVAAFRHPRFAALRSRVMRLDVGWERPARRYAQVYSRLIEAGV